MIRFDWKHFSKLTKRRFRKKFKKPIKSSEIKLILKNFWEGKTDELIQGGVNQIDKYSRWEIVGTPVLDDKKFFNLLLKGKSIRRSGTMKNSEMNSRRKEIKYKIIYTHDLNKVNFKADPKVSKRVHDAIVNQNHYYRINDKQISIGR